jgi:hypothetical protein
VGGDVPIDSETFLMTDFVNLKIKLTQSFGCAHENKVCVHIFREVNTRMCMRIYVCIIFLTKKNTHGFVKQGARNWCFTKFVFNDFINYAWTWSASGIRWAGAGQLVHELFPPEKAMMDLNVISENFQHFTYRQITGPGRRPAATSYLCLIWRQMGHD